MAIDAVKDFLESEDGAKLEKVVFCTFVEKDVNAYDKWLPLVFHMFVRQSAKFSRHFFPPTTETESETPPDNESEWEEVVGGDSAENGPGKEEGTESSKIHLPEVPSGEPVEEGPATKKQKSDTGETS